jgi:hypothetical protein
METDDIKQSLSVPMTITGALAAGFVFAACMASLSVASNQQALMTVALLAFAMSVSLFSHVYFRCDLTFCLSVLTAAVCFAGAMMLCLLGVVLMFKGSI